MTTLKNTKENKIFVEILKKMNECKWVGNVKFKTLEECLISINLQMTDSGFYTPVPIRIKQLSGIRCIRQDGSLNYGFRIMKENDEYLIEELCMDGHMYFEEEYRKLYYAN